FGGFSGPGAGLSGVTASALAAGTYGNALTFSNAGNAFTGSGAALTALNAGSIASGTLALARGGTGADLSATGGTGQLLKQTAAGAAVSVAALTAGDIPNLDAAKITTGNLAVARMPAGGAWALTSNLNLDSNTLVVDPANGRVGVGNAAPAFPLDVSPPSGNAIARFGSGNPAYLIASPPEAGFNAYYNGAGNFYGGTGAAGILNFDTVAGSYNFQTAPSGTAGNPATMTNRFVVGNTGTVSVPSPGTLSIGVRNVA